MLNQENSLQDHNVSVVTNDTSNHKVFKRKLTRSSNSSDNSDMGPEVYICICICNYICIHICIKAH